MALLNYPVLMASDILIYKASMVPVGIDQEPHMEVTREIAKRMNTAYGTDFPEPKSLDRKGRYIPSLTGEGKMSKSVEGSFISLTDDLETIKEKLASAPTDSGKGSEVPEKGAVANLLTFVELFEGQEARKAYETQYTSTGIRYGELKEKLTKAIYKELEPIQKKRKDLEAKPEYIEQVLRDGAKRARAVAEATVAEVRKKMGLQNSATKLSFQGVQSSALGNQITIDDFARVEQRVGLVTEAVNVEKSEKLIKLTVDFGDPSAGGGVRTIFTGVRPFGYTPEDFAGKQFLFVFNLAPRKMMNEESQGMILAVDGPDDKPIFVSADHMPKGSKVR
jgi:methionine--tRNA ligase beta chain